MPWPDLRTLLAALESLSDLLRIPETVDWEHEAVALTRRTFDVEGPALLFEFESVRDAATPCLSGLFSAKRRVA